MEEKYSLLVVDDEAEILELVRDFLEDEGFNIHTATSGSAALEILAGNPIDVLISDIRMAGMNGLELLGRVRADYPSVVCALMSGYAEQYDLTAPCLNKPWDCVGLIRFAHEQFATASARS